MRTNPYISLSKFESVKSELKDRKEIAGELHVYTGNHPDHGYIVLIDSNHHGCLMMIDGPTIIAVNDGIRLD